MSADNERGFGRHVRQLRVVRGLTREQLAERSGLAVETISRLERSQFSPSLRTLSKLAAGLELLLSTIFEAIEIGEIVEPEIGDLVMLLRLHPEVPVTAVTAFLRALLDSRRAADD